MEHNSFITKLVTLLALPFCAFAMYDNNNVQSTMLNQMDVVKNTFESQYAPKDWKFTSYGWELENEVNAAKAKILSTNSPSLPEFHSVLRNFFKSMHDYHVNVYFHSTAASYLPFCIVGTNKKYYISWLDPLEMPDESDLKVGDEIITYNGKPIHEVIQEFKNQHFPATESETNQKIAELQFTTRTASTGIATEEGNVVLSVKDSISGNISSYVFSWLYLPEEIPSPFPKAMPKSTLMVKKPISSHPALHKKMGIHLQDELANVYKRMSANGTDYEENPTSIGSRKSFVPNLGKVVWRSAASANFHAYIFKTQTNHLIGYVRIPTFMPSMITQFLPYDHDASEVLEFLTLIEKFQKETDALVIDQVNNGGGSLWYMLALLSMITDKPLYTSPHQVIINQEDVAEALEVLSTIKTQGPQDSERLETPHGYILTSTDGLRDYYQFILEEWKAKRTFSSPFHIFGIEHIQPHPVAHYSKPILTLINQLDFSCADFFPAMLQDNQRSLLFGSTTAGAGGYVLSTSYPNNLGIKAYTYTGSIVERPNGQKIENVGVTPDIKYEITEKDLSTGKYSDYKKAVNAALETLLKKNSNKSE